MGWISLWILLLAACLTLAAGSPALADTGIVRMEPAQGETMDQPPKQVSLKLAGPVEAAFSPLEVYDAQGRRVDEDNARLDPEDPSTLVVGLERNLPPGAYEVRYRYTGEDGHTLDGSYNFTVSPAPAEETTNASAGGETTSEENSAPREETTESVAVDTTSSEEDSRGGLANILLLAGLGVVALAAVAMFVLRGRRGS